MNFTIEHRSRAGNPFIRIGLPDVYPVNDLISSGRTCAIDIVFHNHGNRPFDKIPHFRIIRGDSGMAFPELLRSYSQLFKLAADFVDGKLPTDKPTMYPRTNYEMTEADLNKLLESFKPVPMIMLQCGPGRSQQERANDAWQELGSRMGFDYMTVQPIEGKGSRFFTAVPCENETQRNERESREKEESKRANIKRLEEEIRVTQEKLTSILNS